MGTSAERLTGGAAILKLNIMLIPVPIPMGGGLPPKQGACFLIALGIICVFAGVMVMPFLGHGVDNVIWFTAISFWVIAVGCVAMTVYFLTDKNK